MNETIAIGWLGPTNNYWGWILGHFRDVSLLTERNFEAWLASQSQSVPDDKRRSALLVAVESRFSDTLDLWHAIEQTDEPEKRARMVTVCGLLGDDWVGHRRTFPLSENLQSFYWYEFYDRILPWLFSLSEPTQAASVRSPMNAAGKRRISPRVQRWIDTSLAIERRTIGGAAVAKSFKLALVVTETATARQLWCDAFSSQNVQCLATTPCNLKIWATPEVIVVDLESEPLAVREDSLRADHEARAETLVRQLVSQFPDAIILVTVSFPRWEAWDSLRECGADIIVAKPFQLTGIFDTLLSSKISDCTA